MSTDVPVPVPVRVRVAAVTGANKGLGRAIVRLLCHRFHGIVYLTSRDEQRGQEACEELRKSGLNPLFHQLDITDQTSVKRFCSHIRDKYAKLDVLVNNAGILFLGDSPESKLYRAEQTVSVNFFALVNICEEILPLVAAAGGNIVNISSSSGHLSRIPSEEMRRRISSPHLSLDGLEELMRSYVEAVKEEREIEEGWGDSPYVVSKVGVNAYTFMLHRRLAGTGVTVNCVHPGYVASDMTRGAGRVSPARGAERAVALALRPGAGAGGGGGGLFVWSDGTEVPWDGPDPRGYIDGKEL